MKRKRWYVFSSHASAREADRGFRIARGLHRENPDDRVRSTTTKDPEGRLVYLVWAQMETKERTP